jgi:hypothetical protein
VSGNQAFIAAGSAGLQVVDIKVSGRPVVQNSVSIEGSAQFVAASKDFVGVLSDRELHIVRSAGPGFPSLTGSIPIAGAARGLELSENLAFVVTKNALEIIDMAPVMPRSLSQLDLPGEPQAVAVSGSQIFVAAGDAGVIVVDATDPVHAKIHAIVDTSEDATGVAVAEERVYIAGAWAGLRVLRATAGGWEESTHVGLGGDSIRRVVAVDSRVFALDVRGEIWLVDFNAQGQALWADRAALARPATGLAPDGPYLQVVAPGVGLQVVNTVVGDLGITYLWPMQDMIQDWPATAFRDTLAAAFENAYAIYQAMGFRAPMSDGNLGGGQDLIDCYIYRMPQGGGLAYTHPEGHASSDCESSFFGHLGIDNLGVVSPNRIKEVAAHELFHLVQYAYDRFEATWMMESTAVWAEQHVRRATVLGNNMTCWFQTPNLPLWYPFQSCRMYGSVHFWLFQEQTTDESIVRRCFERFCDVNIDWLTALKAELAERGLDFNRQLGEFARWNYATGERDDGRHYRQRIAAEVEFQSEHDRYPVQDAEVTPLAENTGANYVRFLGPGRRDTLRVSVACDPRLRECREVTFIATRAPNNHREWVLELDKSGHAEGAIPDWPGYDYGCLIVANGDTSGFALGDVGYDFSYSAWEVGSAPVTSVGRAAPNPTAGETTIGIRIAEDRQMVRLELYDISGRLVQRLVDRTLERGDHHFLWNGTIEHD